MVERVLELLYTAVERSHTVDATVHRWTNQARQIELLRAEGMYRDPPPIPPAEGTWEPPPDVIEATTRLWAARPYWLRWETSAADGTWTSVGVKERPAREHDDERRGAPARSRAAPRRLPVRRAR